MICDECETVSHCLKNGCVPKHQALDRMAENARELGLEYDPVAWVTGLHAGRCVIQTINPAAILPVGIALYTTPPSDEIQRLSALVRAQQITIDKLEALLKEKNCD
jgi:hypothetical protein